MKRRRQILLALIASFVFGIALAVATFAFAGSPASGSERQLHPGKLADALAVFEKGGDQAVPKNVSNLAEHLFSTEGNTAVPEELSPGALRSAEGKRLLAGLGSRNRSLYAWPTTKGAVCALVDGAGGTCDDRLTEGVPAVVVQTDPDAIGSGEPALVAGLVGDDAVRVDVRVGTVVSRARLANNGFFYELGADDRLANAVIVRSRDGSSRTLALAPLTPSTN